MSQLDRYTIPQLRDAIAAATPEQLPALTALLREELSGLEVETKEEALREPATLAAYVSKGEYRLWDYWRLLSRKFVDAVEGRSRFQIWNLPARYGKSDIVKWGSAWLLEHRPEARLIYTSYGYKLARDHAVGIRQMLERNPDVFTTRLLRDRRAADRFVTREDGGVLAAGLGGSITGFGAGGGGGVIIDDPFSSWLEAQSETARENVWSHYQGTLRLRLDDDQAWIIVVMHRLHEDDLCGRLLSREEGRWELVRIPAIAEACDPSSDDPYSRMADPLGREPGEPLEPERFSLAEVQDRASSLSSYIAAAMEQQRPAPAEGGEIKRAWWRWTSNMPEEGDAWITSWDMKLKEKESGDYQVGQAWSRTGTAFFCHAQLRGQWTMLKTACAIALLSVRFPKANRHYIENTGNGPEVMELLQGKDPTWKMPREIGDDLGMTPAERKAVTLLMRRGLLGIQPVNPKGDKRARARAVAAYLEAGTARETSAGCWLPEGKDWAHLLVGECAAFPNGTHDDCVDTWSQALAALAGKIRTRVGPSGGEQKSQWR